MGFSFEKLATLNQKAIALCGRELFFPDSGITIFGVPGFDLQILYKGEDSPYTVETAKPQFRITETDFSFLLASTENQNSSIEGLSFELQTSDFTSSFSIESAVPDLNGWIYLNCILLSRGF